MLRTLVVIFVLLTVAIPLAAQQGSSVPVLPFNTRDFFDAQGTREGEVLARLRFSFDPQDEQGLCLDFGIRPDPRSLLKGYFTFLHSTFDGPNQRKQERVSFSLKGKGVKEEGVSYWSDCISDVKEARSNDEIEILIRRPRFEMIDIQIPFPAPGTYQWVTVVRLPNGGLSWNAVVEEISDEG